MRRETVLHNVEFGDHRAGRRARDPRGFNGNSSEALHISFSRPTVRTRDNYSGTALSRRSRLDSHSLLWYNCARDERLPLSYGRQRPSSDEFLMNPSRLE